MAYWPAFVEYLPNATKGNGQATRLPFARYRRGDVNAWCMVTFDDGQQLAERRAYAVASRAENEHLFLEAMHG